MDKEGTIEGGQAKSARRLAVAGGRCLSECCGGVARDYFMDLPQTAYVSTVFYKPTGFELYPTLRYWSWSGATDPSESCIFFTLTTGGEYSLLAIWVHCNI